MIKKSHLLDAHWRAADYLSVDLIYLMANLLLREPLKLGHVKPRSLGHMAPRPDWIPLKPTRPQWPMIILRSPKIGRHNVEGSGRSNQVPIPNLHKPPDNLVIGDWPLTYQPEELIDESGRLIEELRELAPKKRRRSERRSMGLVIVHCRLVSEFGIVGVGHHLGLDAGRRHPLAKLGRRHTGNTIEPQDRVEVLENMLFGF